MEKANSITEMATKAEPMKPKRMLKAVETRFALVSAMPLYSASVAPVFSAVEPWASSQLFTRELKKELVRIFVEGQSYKNLYISVMSFGFKYGIPQDADLVIDVRFLPNPYYDPWLRVLTGNDQQIIDFVMNHEESRIFLQKFTDLIRFLIPNYIAEGKNQLVIAIGCTGGRHRSVVLANAVYDKLAEDSSYGIRLEHRDIGKDLMRKTQQYESPKA